MSRADQAGQSENEFAWQTRKRSTHLLLDVVERIRTVDSEADQDDV